MSKVLPNGWTQSSISQITSSNSLFADGDWVESKDQDPEGKNRLIQLADIGDGKFINKSNRYLNDEQFLRLRCTELLPNDVLVARMPDPLGRACIFPKLNQKAATVVDVAVIRTSNVDPYWLMSVINSVDFRTQIELSASGTTRTRIARGALAEIPLQVPPIQEQQKIASILTAVDEVIESTQAQINKLKDLKTGMMQELLTKGIGRDGQPHTEFKDSPVGRIPKAWTFKAVGDICKVTSGGTPDRTNLEFWNGNIPWIKTGEINYTTIYSAEEYITELGLKNSSTKLIPAGSVLMAMYGQGITRGKVALLGIDACLNQACLAMLPNNELDKYFLFYFFSKEYENLRLLVQEGTQKNLNAGIVKEILLPLPPMDEQVEIRKRLQAVDINIESKQRKLEIVVDLKKALMQDLLTGNVRVP